MDNYESKIGISNDNVLLSGCTGCKGSCKGACTGSCRGNCSGNCRGSCVSRSARS